MPDIRKLVCPGRSCRRVLNSELQGGLDASARKKILELFDLYRRQQDVPRVETPGARFMMGMAANILAVRLALRDAGFDEERTLEVVERVQWEMSRDLGRPLFLLSCFLRRDALRRIRFINDLLWGVLFTRPYRREAAVGPADSLVFRVLRCPVAEYLLAHDESRLCRSAFCNLDARLAQAWGAEFIRQGTLADGAPYCDFCFRPRPASPSPDP